MIAGQNIETISINNKKLLLLSASFALSAIIFLPYSLYIVAGSLIFFLAYLYQEKMVIPCLIFAYLIITSDINETARIILNIFCIVYIGHCFVKEYGTELKNYPRFPNIINKFILFFIFSLTISSVLSSQMLISFTEVFRQVIFFFLIYFIFAISKRYKYLLNNITWVLIIASTFIACSIIFIFITSDKEIYILVSSGLIHAGGYFNNVAAAGGIFVVGISLTASFLLINKSFNKRTKILLLVVFILQILGLLLTNSRAAILGCFVSLLYMVIRLNKKIIIKILFAFLVCIVLSFIIFPSFYSIFLTFFRFERVFSNTRYLLWPMAIDIIKDNIFFGVGPGMFKYHIYKYINVMIGSWDEQQIRWIYENAGSGHAHNFILFLTSELGILGFICAISLPFIFFRSCHSALKIYAVDAKIKPIIIGITGLGIGLFVRSFFESTGLLTYGWITRDLPFWLSFIILIDNIQKTKSEEKIII